MHTILEQYCIINRLNNISTTNFPLLEVWKESTFTEALWYYFTKNSGVMNYKVLHNHMVWNF